jgi:hypothetical protein
MGRGTTPHLNCLAIGAGVGQTLGTIGQKGLSIGQPACQFTRTFNLNCARFSLRRIAGLSLLLDARSLMRILFPAASPAKGQLSTLFP